MEGGAVAGGAVAGGAVEGGAVGKSKGTHLSRNVRYEIDGRCDETTCLKATAVNSSVRDMAIRSANSAGGTSSTESEMKTRAMSMKTTFHR